MGDAKMTADERVAAARIGRFHEHVAIDAVWCADAIAIAEAHAAAAVAEVARERDSARSGASLAEGRLLELLDVLRERTDALDRVVRERDRAVCRAEQAEARVAELEALLRESQDLFMEAGPFHALRPAIKAQWRRRARAHINALASALAPQAPPARREGEIP